MSARTEKNDEPDLQRKKAQLSIFTRLKYWFIRGSLMWIVKIGGLDGLYRFGQGFGFCEYLLQYRKRKRAYRRFEEIVGRSLPLSQKRLIARRQICRVRCDKMIYTIMDRIDRSELLRRVEIVGKDHWDQAVTRGQGTFLMFSHMGSHHLGGILLTLLGYPVIGLRDPNESPLRLYVQDQFVRNFPEFSDLRITPSDSFARTFFHAFKKNSIVAAAMDVWRDRGNVRTVKVTVFGQEREFLSGMTHIALRSRSVILTGFLLSLPGYRYRMIFKPWFNDPDRDSDHPETVERIMQHYARLIEDHAREYPCHISKTSRSGTPRERFGGVL